jgi:cation-transporting ATPase E
MTVAPSSAPSSTHPDTTQHTGLSASEVQDRIQRGQTNNYKARVSRTYWDIVRDNLLNLFNIVLGTLLLIVIWMGDYATAFFAGFSVVTNTFLGMIQEINAKRKLDQLATLGEIQVAVLRDGQRHMISMRDVVLDDLIYIEPGDKVVVDGVVVHSDSLEMDESLLTGESDAVFKEEDAEVFSGSFCIAGTGMMRATRVGADSNINKLTEIAKEYKRTKTPTQNYIDIIVEVTVLVMFIFVPMLLISNLLVRDVEFLDAIRNAVVFVTSLVPQGLVLVGILSLTIGAIKISRHDTLIQKVNAVESLANATVLCFDKTGTLTKNELRVTDIIILNGDERNNVHQQLGAYLHNLGHLNRTAGAVRDFVDDEIGQANYTPKQREVPFTSGRKWGAIVFEDDIFVLGAPERILPQRSADDSVVVRTHELSQQGQRVLAFARATSTPEGTNISAVCEPIALVTLSDTIRPDIQETLQSFRDEGIQLKVISGDSLRTVQAIAHASGMDADEAYSGDQLDAMNDGELAHVVQNANVFGRIEPDTKRRIVSALQTQGQYVAMVGDGVNDVPALKQANLAIVMNDGTQISKDVADIVLLNNAMSTLPLAFHEGKETTQTIFGTMKMFLVKSFYNVALFIFVAFMALPFPITPVQISWITFGTVNIPATLIAFGIVRPQFMRTWREDVLDYILTGGIIGSLLGAMLYVVVYFTSDGNIMMTRSAITLFFTLYGAFIVMSIQGVNFYQPKTFWEHRRIVALMLVLTTLTILIMYGAQPMVGFFEFYIFHPVQDAGVLLFITVLFLTSIWLVAHGQKYRYMLKRLYHLFERSERGERPNTTPL